MPLYRAQAIVLRRRSFQETDKLLALYTREFGKLSAIAKGARRAQSRLVGATEPLVYGRFQLATGRNLDIVTEASARHTFTDLRRSNQKISSALYIAELTDALVDERQPSHELFDLLLSTLYLLESRDREDNIVRRFQVQALEQSGYAPEVNRCVLCRALRPQDRPAVFSPQVGGIICSKCRSGQADLIPASAGVLETVFILQTLPAHRVDEISLAQEECSLLDRLIRSHINCHVEREIKSQPVSGT